MNPQDAIAIYLWLVAPFICFLVIIAAASSRH